MSNKRNRHVDHLPLIKNNNTNNTTDDSNESENSTSAIQIYFIQNNQRLVGFKNEQMVVNRSTTVQPIYILDGEEE